MDATEPRGVGVQGTGARPLASVVIPAHNEGAVIARTLTRLLEGLPPDALDVVVVCNGCTDATATIARRVAPHARVLEIPTPSKAEAVRVGNLASDVFPRVHLDADVVLSGADLLKLIAPLHVDEVLATAPRRAISRARSAWLVRWYYDVWEQLPQVRAGLFGRGAFALSDAGQARVSALPEVMSDDLAVSDAFTDAERRVVSEAEVTVYAPGTARDLLRRRVRVATGNAQADACGVRRPHSATGPRGLLRLALSQPSLAVRLPVFAGFAVIARAASRSAVQAGDFSSWQRDESSRA